MLPSPSPLPLVTHLALRRKSASDGGSLRRFRRHFEKLHGKELSFNNILDITAATNLIAEFDSRRSRF